MRKAILLPLLTLGLLAAVPRRLEPKIEKFDGVLQLDMGKAVQDAVKKFDPYFQVWNETDFLPAVRTSYQPTAQQTLAGVVGDFNSDKFPDVVLFGRNRTHNRILAALSDGAAGSFQIVEVDKSAVTDPRKEWIEGPKGHGAGLWRYLSHLKPGLLKSPYEKQSVQLKSEAFQETYFKKGSVVHYWKDGRFERFTKSD